MKAVEMAAQKNGALQIIFSFFLGLMVVAFIGVGVNTFYESPQAKIDPELQKLYRQQEAINRQYSSAGKVLPPEQQAKSDALQVKIDQLNDKIQADMKIWARNTSIILIVFATLVMAVSLVRSEQLRVISNGLLLGGLFTMLYGVGMAVFSGQSTARFFTITVALIMAVGLGYMKFVRERQADAAAVAGDGSVAPVDAAGVAALVARMEALEARTEAAAAALRGKEADDR